ncbi:hypothetical protein BS17DRAFT_798091 [Gyrodon lividus]|nr:hypothetical protein BS17DRAFT_798091 [Gyrodon lividus]
MMPEIFNCILDQISPHANFQSNSQNCQLPVALQLAIFLFHAGHNGNAVSPEDVAQWAGVMMVAILDQHDLFVNIPSEDSEDMEMAHKLAKSKLCLIITPHNLLIVDYGLGHPGSVHDACMFQGTRIASQPATLIPHNHWIWDDTVYLTEMWCVVPFKKPRGGGLS